MKTEKPAIILYFTACILAVIATAIKSETLLIFTKPIVIPAIFFYYLSIKKTKFNVWYGVFLLLTFAGDTIVLLDLKNETIFIMVPFILSYIILLCFITADVKRLRFSWPGLATGLFAFGLLIVAAFTLIHFFSAESKALTVPVIIYGVILGLQAGLAAYHFHVSSTNMSFYLAMTALFNCVSDVFYVIFTLIIIDFPEFQSLDIALQIFSYYFVIKYFALRKPLKSV
ncbi:MAG: hypothetical protein EOO50_17140 [Flavobacterium sp.]|uniref:lysoplasmalogenase family protein n=1 Tax=Flavobacterium sp. TaxID=239 RepID=UPI00121E1BEB|nr:lysoplasmalogenase family protein [Flavobacterium sp.]RZJ63301.1 MAG: hypothetical protein EOO50_17140 [Flavobacterium sp.]